MSGIKAESFQRLRLRSISDANWSADGSEGQGVLVSGEWLKSYVIRVRSATILVVNGKMKMFSGVCEKPDFECSNVFELNEVFDMLGVDLLRYPVQLSPVILTSCKAYDSFGAGCYVMFGESGSGKSTLISGLMRRVSHSNVVSASGTRVPVLVDVGEPNARSVTLQQAIRGLAASCVWRLAECSSQSVESRVYIVDSLRELVYSTGGNALSGGISSGLLTALTTLSQLCARSNTILLGALNPMDITGNSDKIDALLETINGSTSGILYNLNIVDYSNGVVSFNVKSRLDGRREHHGDVSVLSDAIINFNSGGSFSISSASGDNDSHETEQQDEVVVGSVFIPGETDDSAQARAAAVLFGNAD